MEIRNKIKNLYCILLSIMLIICSLNLLSFKGFSETLNYTNDISNFSIINSQYELPDKEQLMISNKKSEIKYKYINLLLNELNNVIVKEKTVNAQSKIENIVKDFVKEIDGDKFMEISLLERIGDIQNNYNTSNFKSFPQLLANSIII